jgi:Tfp pilus assembly protein PilF
VLLLRGKPSEAAVQYRSAIRADPGYAPAWSGLAATLAIRGDSARAERYYRIALQIDPNLKGAQKGLRLIRPESARP